MKHWQETAELVGRARDRMHLDEPVVMAVVVGIQGSTYRRPGAKLLIEANGRMTGQVSGGCLEQDIREAAMMLMAGGAPRHVHYDTSDAEDRVWGMGLGCNGKVDVFLVPLDPGHHGERVAEVAGLMEGNAPIALQWKLAENAAERLEVVPADATRWDGDRFIESILPPPTLLIIGAGDDAIPLAKQAYEVGFRVKVVDHRKAFLTEERFPLARERMQMRPEEAAGWVLDTQTLAIVKTHALQHDLNWVKRLVATEVPYIGLLGPRDRRDEIWNQIDSVHHPRLYGPVGLDLGGEGAEQVALSIVAEALAVWHNRRPQHLRDRTRAIHAE